MVKLCLERVNFWNLTKGVDGAFFTTKYLINSRKSSDERGQSLVEFTLILPIFLLILLGMIDFGWYLKLNNDLVRANAQGARIAAFNGTDTEVKQAVVDAATNPLQMSAEHVFITREDLARTRGTWVEVTSTSTYQSVTGFSVIHLLLNDQQITAVTTSRIE